MALRNILSLLLAAACILHSSNASVLVEKEQEEKAAVQIIVDNRRSGNTAIHCCSGDDDLCQRTVEPNRYYNFAFTPNIWGTTAFNCRASYAVVEDPTVPVIRTIHKTWTAYGEWDGVNQGSAIFELRDDGIYWDGNFMAVWENTTTFPPSLSPLCSQFPTPCQASLQ